MLLRCDRLSEVKADVVHQETLELSLQPLRRMLRLDVCVQSIKNGILGQVYVLDQTESLHVDCDTNPVEQFVAHNIILLNFFARLLHLVRV